MTNPVLIIYTALGLIFSYIAFRSPRVGLVLLLVVFAVADWVKRLLFIFPPVSQIEIFWILAIPDLILFALLARLFFQTIVKKDLSFKLQTTDILLGIFFCWALFSILIHKAPLFVKLAGAKSTILYISLYFVGACLIRESTDLKRLFRVFICIAIPTGIYGVFQFFNGPTWFEWDWLKSGYTFVYSPERGIGDTAWFRVFRPFSIFASCDILGFHMMFSLLMCLYFFLTSTRESGRRSYGLLALIIAVFSLTTATRSPWIGIIFGLLTLFISYKPAGQKLRALVTVACLAGLFFSLQPISRYFESTGSLFLGRISTLGTFKARVTGIKAFVQEPEYRSALGNGLGTSGEIISSKFGTQGKLFTHNSFLTFSYEVGLIGLGLLLLYLASFFWSLKRPLHFIVEKPLRLQLVICLGLVIGFLAAAQFNENFSMRPANAYFWLISGVLSRSFLWMH